MPPAEATKPALYAARTRVAVKADANGNLPTELEVMRAGMWPEMSNKGMLYITPQDLQQYVDNFKAGIGCAGGINQLPIDFSHENYSRAAGWITDMRVDGGDVLIATVDWSDAGKAALLGKEFKFFSPSFYPSCLGEWCDPEDWSDTAVNVLVGGALTNIPFFKDLKPVIASRDSQEGSEKYTLFVDADAKGANMRKLDEVRVMAAADLTDEDKALLVENKAKLSADERKKFGLEETEKPAPVNTDQGVQVTADQQQILADIQSGKKVLVDAAEHNELKTTVEGLKTKVEAQQTQLETDLETKIRERVEACALQGKIVADQVPKWVKRAKADASVLDDLENMTSNPVLAAENGKDKEGKEVTASEDLDARIKKVMADEKIDYSTAVQRVANSDPELVNNREKELAGKA